MKISRHTLKCFLLLSYIAIAQTNDPTFQTLRPYDTITALNNFNAVKEIDKVNDNLFFAAEYLKNKGLFLIERNETCWIVYDYNDFVSNYAVGKHHKLNSQYVAVEVGASRSGYGINVYSWYLIFDLKNKSYLTLNKSSYNADEKDAVLNKCESIIKFKNNIFTIKRNCFPKNECGNCIESGMYKIKNGKLAKLAKKSTH